MPIHFSCPDCATDYTVADAVAGKRTRCPKCGTDMRVPGGSRAPEEPPPPRAPEPPSAVRPYREPDARENDRDDYRDNRRDSYRDDYRARRRGRYDDDDRPARQGFRCPYCGSHAVPYFRPKISAAGWVVFALMLLFCFPLFWVGLLITEQQRFCQDCGIKLG